MYCTLEIDSDVENDQFVKVKDLTKEEDDSSSCLEDDDVTPKKSSFGRRVQFAEDAYPASQSILRKHNNSSILLEELRSSKSTYSKTKEDKLQWLLSWGVFGLIILISNVSNADLSSTPVTGFPVSIVLLNTLIAS